MKLIHSLRTAVAGVLLFTSSTFAQTSKHPNVLFIVSDDLNVHINCYGDNRAITPNIDRLAAHGIRFDHAYAQYPVCNPSRTSFLSGLHPETTDVTTQLQKLHDTMPGVVYMPDHFHQNGYFTAAIGKIEHGGHHEIKWDVADDLLQGKDDEAQRAAAKVGRNRNPNDPPYFEERMTSDNDPTNLDTEIAKRIVKLLEEKREKPFFIAAGFHKPHVPHVAPKKFFDMYPLDKIQTTYVPPGDEKDIPPAALASKKNYQPDMPEEQKKKIIRAYMACVTYFDSELGHVLDAMDKNNLWDNTVVVFIGDHGWNFGEHNWWAKASLFEESCKAPLMISAPGAKPGHTAHVVEFLDIYPTVAELCALTAPPQSEGKSLAPLLQDPNMNWDKPAYTALGKGAHTVRTEQFRYTQWSAGKGGEELYDHFADDHEFTNLAGDPKYNDVVAKMKTLLAQRPKAQVK